MKLRGKKAMEILGQTILWIILIASLLIFSVPFFFMITNSFEEFSYVLPYPPKLFPTRLDFSAYRHILSMDIFPTALANSVINTVITVVISVFVSTLSAYGFACIRFPGRDKLFAVYLFTLMMPGFLNIIPQFLVLKQFTLPGLPNGTDSGLRCDQCLRAHLLPAQLFPQPAKLAGGVGAAGRRRSQGHFLPGNAAPLCPGGGHHDHFCLPGLLGGILYGEGSGGRE